MNNKQIKESKNAIRIKTIIINSSKIIKKGWVLMARQKGKLLARCQSIKGSEYTIRVTRHALEQMEVRGVSGSDIVETISALGLNRLLHLQAVSCHFCLINNRLNTTVIFSWFKNRIIVLTVLAKSDQVFAKRGTWYINLSDELSSWLEEIA